MIGLVRTSLYLATLGALLSTVRVPLMPVPDHNSKIVANRGHYRRRVLARLYSNFCDHSLLFCTGIRPILSTGDLKGIHINYYRCSKFLLYLPRSYREYKTD